MHLEVRQSLFYKKLDEYSCLLRHIVLLCSLEFLSQTLPARLNFLSITCQTTTTSSPVLLTQLTYQFMPYNSVVQALCLTIFSLSPTQIACLLNDGNHTTNVYVGGCATLPHLIFFALLSRSATPLRMIWLGQMNGAPCSTRKTVCFTKFMMGLPVCWSCNNLGCTSVVMFLACVWLEQILSLSKSHCCGLAYCCFSSTL